MFQELYHEYRGNVNLRIIIAGTFVDYLRLQEFGAWWFARKTLRGHVDEFVKRFVADTWEIEILGDNTRVAGTKEVEERANRVFDFLAKDKEAIQLRDLLQELSDKRNSSTLSYRNN